jgi:hypothetical protein
MRRDGTSAYVLSFPARPETRTTALVEVAGRETVVRLGLFFAKIGHHRRAVYENLDGEIILADACVCEVNWGSEHPSYKRSLSVTRSVNCPINCHMIAARQSEVA